MGKVYFKNRKINESISNQTLDDIVVECSPLYIEANRLGRSVEEKDYRNYVTNMQLKQRERLLNQIAEKINKFYDDDVLFVGYNNRDEYDEFVDLQPINKHDDNFVRILTDALYSGISFTEAEKRHYDNVNRIMSNNRNAEIEDNIRRYGKYDRAYYASGFGKVESPSKYSGKTLDTPKVLGKIELPKEDEKRTQRRNKFVRGVQESYNDNYADSDITRDYNSSQPYSYYIEERYRLKGIDDCLNNYDIESLALLIMEAIEDGKFDDSNETPIQVYNKLIKDIPSRIKYLYESTLRSCDLGKEWVRDSWDGHNK